MPLVPIASSDDDLFMLNTGWPAAVEALVAVQDQIASEADHALKVNPWVLSGQPLIGGCFVAFARGEAGPGSPGDHAWAAAVVWQPRDLPTPRDTGAELRGATSLDGPRRAHDIEAQSVVSAQVPASYSPGLLALREGPILERAVRGLSVMPDVLLVDATGVDHPRRAGLAIHLGAACGIPTVGVTHRALRAVGTQPLLTRGAMAPAWLGNRVVGYWVCTRSGARTVMAHAGWRTDPEIAAEVLLIASTESARTPVPLLEARRVAREARALAAA